MNVTNSKEDETPLKTFTIPVKEYDQIHFLLMLSLPLAMSDPDYLIKYKSESLMIESDGIQEFDGFDFGVKPTEGLYQKDLKLFFIK